MEAKPRERTDKRRRTDELQLMKTPRAAALVRLKRDQPEQSSNRAPWYLLRLGRLLDELQSSNDPERDARRLELYLDLFFSRIKNVQSSEGGPPIIRQSCNAYVQMLSGYRASGGDLAAAELDDTFQSAKAALDLLRAHLPSHDLE